VYCRRIWREFSGCVDKRLDGETVANLTPAGDAGAVRLVLEVQKVVSSLGEFEHSA
jgi:hypothetical protein